MTNSYGLLIYALMGAATCSLTIEYYQQLIYQEITKTATYQLPKNNEEFRKGIESGVINDYGEYDVVVVGAGSAGSVVATRLSEVDDIGILLLEAGGEENDFNQIPAMWSYLPLSEFNWGYYSTPQRHSGLGMMNRQIPAPRGKVLGGCSSINGLAYVRGNCEDYNKWAALGNRGWSCDDVLPYFKKSENSQVRGASGLRGTGGFWNVEYAVPASSLSGVFVEGSVEAQQAIVDYNGRSQNGSSITQHSTKRGKRQSLASAFLNNARERSNLKVVTKALATKVVIDPLSRQAKGVEFVTRNKKFLVIAKKEVVLSSGAFNTPQILMLSGVGPRKHLNEMKVPLVVDLPVGHNLIEHPKLSFVVRTNYASPSIDIKELIELYLNGLGPLTRPLDATGFLYTRNGSHKVPSIQYFLIPQYNFNATYLSGKSDLYQKSDILWDVVLLHEKSRGRVFLNSSSPVDFPNIDFNMFEYQEDVDTLIEGVEYVLKLMETEAFKKINATVLKVPVCANLTLGSKKHLECLIRNLGVTAFHPCGTAAMGPDPKQFVVNDKLEVHGVGNLRVVDASIFPDSVSGNTNAPTVMIAEKAADLIKAKLGY